MKSKSILTVTSLALIIGFAGVIAQAQQGGESQNMGMMDMMGVSRDQCIEMMKQAGISPALMMRCSMMGTLQVDPYDPSAILAMKNELSLTAEQQEKLDAIQKEAREKAKSVLTEAQQNDLKPLLDTPNTMPGMWRQWHSKIDKKTGSAMMMCPWMDR